MANVAALRSELQESRARVLAALGGLEEEQFRFTPPGETWSIAAHLAHLLRTERLFAERALAALGEEEPRIASTRIDNERDPELAATLAVPQIIHGLQAARRLLGGALDAGDASLERAVIHERLGRMTIEQIAVKISGHEREHAAEVERLARMAPRGRRVTIPMTPRS
jgi:hypothetical protein